MTGKQKILVTKNIQIATFLGERENIQEERNKETHPEFFFSIYFWVFYYVHVYLQSYPCALDAAGNFL